MLYAVAASSVGAPFVAHPKPPPRAVINIISIYVTVCVCMQVHVIINIIIACVNIRILPSASFEEQ